MNLPVFIVLIMFEKPSQMCVALYERNRQEPKVDFGVKQTVMLMAARELRISRREISRQCLPNQFKLTFTPS